MRDEKVLITIINKKPRIFWRTVRYDKKGEYVMIDKEKRYLNELVRHGYGKPTEYRIK